MTAVCSICKKEIEGKPWISIQCDKDCIIHGCSYICNKKMSLLVGKNYLDKVINKEDFNYLFPIIRESTSTKTVNTFEREELLNEIEEEERRIEALEWEYQQTSSDSDDWENSE